MANTLFWGLCYTRLNSLALSQGEVDDEGIQYNYSE